MRDILKDFCSTDEMRQNLMEPFTRNGYTYASDGHIAIRIKADEIYPDAGGGKGIEDMFSTPDNCNIEIDLTKLPELEKEPIYEKIKDAIKCTFCSGTGDCQCDCGDEHECGQCNGTGIEEEEKYSDKIVGYKPKPLQYFKIGEGYFDSAFILKFAKHFKKITMKTTSVMHANRAVADNADILIMPLRYAEESNMPIKIYEIGESLRNGSY